MASWATKRKLSYTGIIAVLAIVFIAVPLFLSYYKAPTCSDRIKNQGELDVDCGGPCSRLCQSAFLPAKVSWTKFEKVYDGVYNIAAYIVNPNLGGAVVAAPYKFSLYDKDGVLITEVKGNASIPVHRNTIVFQGSVPTQKRQLVKVTFEFTGIPQWQKSVDTLDSLSIVDKKYTEDVDGSSLEVTLENTGLYAYRNVRVNSVLYDSLENAIGFSTTVVDRIEPQKREIAPFTWPISRQGKVATIEILPVVSPVILR